jgi:nucleotide-binding universal stress UspA family protein
VPFELSNFREEGWDRWVLWLTPVYNSPVACNDKAEHVEDGPMATTLAFVDFSDATVTIVRMAREVAHAFGMKLILMHISTPDADVEGTNPRSDLSRRGVAAEMHHYHRELKLLALECSKLGVQTTALLVRGRSGVGNPVPKMVTELKRVKPSLIVMGTHQHGRFVEAMFGSASSKIVHKTACPILLIPSQNRSVRWPKRG